MLRANVRPIVVFLILVCACAAYIAGVMEITLRLGFENSKARFAPFIKILLLIIPVSACAAVQFHESTRRAVSAPRLWLEVAAAAIGAPLLGAWLMLVVSFILFSKSP